MKLKRIKKELIKRMMIKLKKIKCQMMKSDIKNFKKTLKTKANNNKKNEDQN